MKKIVLIALMFVLLTASVAALPLTIDRVEVNDVEMDTSSSTRLDILRDDEFEVEITFTPYENINDVEFEVTIYGFEYNDIDRIIDHIDNADYDAGVTYVKRLHLYLSDEVEEDDYKLRILVADRNNDVLIQNYDLKIDVPRHKIKVEDIILFPPHVEAGRALLATVRLENKGEKTEEDVRVTVSLPELGLQGTDYIEEIDPGDEEETEEIFIAVPECTEAGNYIVRIEVAYDEGHEVERADTPVTIIASDRCQEEEEEDTSSVVIIVEQPPVQPEVIDEAPKSSGKKVLRAVLEIILLVLIGILVVIGLIIGFTRMGKDDSF